MNQQKGFSLTEVLASLVLVTTLALFLVQQQLQCKQLLNQLILRSKDIQFLDQVKENINRPLQINKVPSVFPVVFLPEQNKKSK